jgi:DNA-binding NarL/FixJ family response regulator
MSISISSSLSSSPSTNANFSNATVQSAQQTQATPVQTADTVRLSESQQVHQLYNQGQQISQIAFTLRLTVEAVYGYLGITSSSK